jgi:hypothetical protein
MKRETMPLSNINIQCILILALLAPGPAFSDTGFYMYVNPKGHRVFVDDVGKIPPQMREAIKHYIDPGTGAGRPDLRTAAPAPPHAVAVLDRRDDARDAGQTPVITQGNRVLVPVTLKYGILETQARLLLDTGATTTILFQHTADRLFMRAKRWTKGRTAGGDAIDVGLATLDLLRVGPHQFYRLETGIVSMTRPAADHDGLLGMDVLKGTAYTIDFADRQIRWHRRSAGGASAAP